MLAPPRHILAASAFVTDDDGRILVVRTRDRGWELPGGQVEEGEDVLAAVVREVMEETGYTVMPERLVGVYTRVQPPYIVLHTYRCRVVGGSLAPEDDVIVDAAWMPAAEARAAIGRPAMAARLDDALAARVGVVVHRAYTVDPYVVVAERDLPG